MAMSVSATDNFIIEYPEIVPRAQFESSVFDGARVLAYIWCHNPADGLKKAMRHC
jgi:hypothetical protein